MSDLLDDTPEVLDVYAERILDAARRELLQFGLRRTSLDNIARAAKVGRATLFRRFPNRDALNWALAAREAQRSISRVDAQLAPIDDPEEHLVVGVIAVMREITESDLLRRLLETDAEQMLPLLAGRGAPVLPMGTAYIAGNLRRLAAEGAELTAEPEVLAELLARVVLSITMNPDGALALDDDAQLEALARETFVPMVLRRPRGR